MAVDTRLENYILDTEISQMTTLPFTGANVSPTAGRF